MFLTWKGHHRQRSASPANCFAVRLRVGDLIFAGIFAAEARVSSNEGGENMGMCREIYGYMDYYRYLVVDSRKLELTDTSDDVKMAC